MYFCRGIVVREYDLARILKSVCGHIAAINVHRGHLDGQLRCGLDKVLYQVYIHVFMA